ncbi:sensor histidine kinase [Trebonia kvetii]|uniref:histidine kinase n=2 Tax=Trebonia kvetii TaxID=2480626 RepID=A0A6P2BWI9_9ACTN|nr:sensor histidine kinase [Trebonia kvetii]
MADMRWRRAGDLAVSGTLAALAVVGALVAAHGGGDPARAWGACAAEFASLAALAFRRRRPLPVLAVTAACALAAAVIADRSTIGPLLPAIALYTLGTVSTWRVTAAAAAAVVTAYGAVAAAAGNPAEFLAAVMTCAVAAAIGLYIGEHRRLLERAAGEQRLTAAQAVLAERVWIARELHDALGHHVSLLVVQAGAVQASIPEESPARPVLTAMIAGGREAMAEMRRLVDVLRPAGEENGPETAGSAGFGPVPGVADLPALGDRLRASGLPVDVHIDVGAPLGRTASSTAYRIVQEALTNVIKHAGHVATRVDVTRTGTVLDLRVTNAAAKAAPADLGSGGHGLDGIRRRAALFGGEVFAGPVPGGGYALRATLRLGEIP